MFPLCWNEREGHFCEDIFLLDRLLVCISGKSEDCIDMALGRSIEVLFVREDVDNLLDLKTRGRPMRSLLSSVYNLS